MLRAAILAALLATPAIAKEPTNKLSKLEREAMALSPADASFRISITGTDELDPAVWVSTKPFLTGTAYDRYFRARIDKITGDTFYQLYFRSASPRNPIRLTKMTYLVNGQLKSANIDRIGVDVSCRSHQCTYFEDHVADLPREDLNVLATGSEANDLFWRMRLFGEATTGEDATLLRNETAGFLIAVDRERARLGFKVVESNDPN